MIKNASLIAFVFIFSQIANADNESVANAENSAMGWLALVDERKYRESWSQASLLLRTHVTQSDWAENLDSIRGPLGALERREVDSAEYDESLPEVPDGEYVIFVFSSTFENSKHAYEVVGMTKELDSTWRAIGYSIQ